jgi:hypothetical protein
MAELRITKLPNIYNREIAYITLYEESDIRQLALYDALILDYTDATGCLKLLRLCRSSFIGSIYLIPIFIYSIEKNIDPKVESMSDGIISSLQVEGIITKIDKLKSRQANLTTVDSDTPDIRIMTKIMRYLYTREIKLQPIVDPHSSLGYSYPILSEHYNNGNISDMFRLTHDLINREFFKPKFVDRLHLCSNCYSSFINYRETCPKCGSGDLVTENLIHHLYALMWGPSMIFTVGIIWFVQNVTVCSDI